MKYFPDLPSRLPPVEIFPVEAGESMPQHPQGGEVELELELELEPLVKAQTEPQIKPSAGIAAVGRPAIGAGRGWIETRLPIVNEFLESSNLEANSRRAYDRALRRFVGWSVCSFSELTPQVLMQYREWLEGQQGRNGKPLSRATTNQELAALRSFLGWLHERYPQHCLSNPAVGIKSRKISLPPAQDLPQRVLEEVWIALNHLGETALRDQMLVHLLCHGLRASEAASLNLASFDGRVLFLAATKNHSSRLVPLSEATLGVMAEYLEWRRSETGAETGPDAPLLVSLHPGLRGERLGYNGIYRAIKRIGQTARARAVGRWVSLTRDQQPDLLPVDLVRAMQRGFPEADWPQEAGKLVEMMPVQERSLVLALGNLHPHAFRHTYATKLLLSGMDPAHARRLTGHESQQVFRRYTQAVEQQAAIAAFEQIEAGAGLVLVKKD